MHAGAWLRKLRRGVASLGSQPKTRPYILHTQLCGPNSKWQLIFVNLDRSREEEEEARGQHDDDDAGR